MNEPTSFASLGPTLLARKGAAKPAMRSQHWNSGAASGAQAAEALEDLGWNDMGEEDQEVEHSATVLSLTPARPSRAEDFEYEEDEDETADSAPLIAGNDIGEVHAVEQIDDSAEEEDSTSEFVNEALNDDDEDYEEEYDEAADAELAKWVAHKPEVRRQQQELAETLGAEEEAYEQPRRKRASRRDRESALDKGGRAAFTLRLDAERHLKLRLACTIRNRSAQQLVTEALDDFLGDIREVEALAAQLKKAN
jgi:hypothetical protein